MATSSKRFLLKIKLTGRLFLYGVGVWCPVWPPFHQICRTPQCRQVEEKTQNFRSFPTNSSPKGGLIDVGRLLLQFDRVILGLEGRMDSPFSDFGITVTWRRCVGVNWWPGSWAMLLLLSRGSRSSFQRRSPVLGLLRLRNTVGRRRRRWRRRTWACATTTTPSFPSSPSSVVAQSEAHC